MGICETMNFGIFLGGFSQGEGEGKQIEGMGGPS